MALQRAAALSEFHKVLGVDERDVLEEGLDGMAAARSPRRWHAFVTILGREGEVVLHCLAALELQLCTLLCLDGTSRLVLPFPLLIKRSIYESTISASRTERDAHAPVRVSSIFRSRYMLRQFKVSVIVQIRRWLSLVLRSVHGGLDALPCHLFSGSILGGARSNLDSADFADGGLARATTHGRNDAGTGTVQVPVQVPVPVHRWDRCWNSARCRSTPCRLRVLERARGKGGGHVHRWDHRWRVRTLRVQLYRYMHTMLMSRSF